MTCCSNEVGTRAKCCSAIRVSNCESRTTEQSSYNCRQRRWNFQFGYYYTSSSSTDAYVPLALQTTEEFDHLESLLSSVISQLKNMMENTDRSQGLQCYLGGDWVWLNRCLKTSAADYPCPICLVKYKDLLPTKPPARRSMSAHNDHYSKKDNRQPLFPMLYGSDCIVPPLLHILLGFGSHMETILKHIKMEDKMKIFVKQHRIRQQTVTDSVKRSRCLELTAQSSQVYSD